MCNERVQVDRLETRRTQKKTKQSKNKTKAGENAARNGAFPWRCGTFAALDMSRYHGCWCLITDVGSHSSTWPLQSSQMRPKVNK